MAIDNVIWITDHDKRNGSSEAEAVRSWARALELSKQTGKGFYITDAGIVERMGKEAIERDIAARELAERPQPNTYA